jgi:hypothetical protein
LPVHLPASRTPQCQNQRNEAKICEPSLTSQIVAPTAQAKGPAVCCKFSTRPAPHRATGFLALLDQSLADCGEANHFAALVLLVAVDFHLLLQGKLGYAAGHIRLRHTQRQHQFGSAYEPVSVQPSKLGLKVHLSRISMRCYLQRTWTSACSFSPTWRIRPPAVR